MLSLLLSDPAGAKQPIIVLVDCRQKFLDPATGGSDGADDLRIVIFVLNDTGLEIFDRLRYTVMI